MKIVQFLQMALIKNKGYGIMANLNYVIIELLFIKLVPINFSNFKPLIYFLNKIPTKFKILKKDNVKVLMDNIKHIEKCSNFMWFQFILNNETVNSILF